MRVKPPVQFITTSTTTLMVSLTAADAASCGDRGAYQRALEQQVHSKGAQVKQWLHDFLSHPWLAAKAGGRRPCGMRKTEDQLVYYTLEAAPSVTNVPMARPLRFLISCPVQALAGPLKSMCSRRPDPPYSMIRIMVLFYDLVYALAWGASHGHVDEIIRIME